MGFDAARTHCDLVWREAADKNERSKKPDQVEIQIESA